MKINCQYAPASVLNVTSLNAYRNMSTEYAQYCRFHLLPWSGYHIKTKVAGLQNLSSELTNLQKAEVTGDIHCFDFLIIFVFE